MNNFNITFEIVTHKTCMELILCSRSRNQIKNYKRRITTII